MLEKQTYSQSGTTDLRMVNCGVEDCSPTHRWGPGIRDRYIIHFVVSGTGVFNARGKEYKLSKDEGFLVCPGEVIEYTADGTKPWTYAWVGFDGIRAGSILLKANIDATSPVFKVNNPDMLLQLIHKMLLCANIEYGKDEMLLGLLYEFLSNFISSNGSREQKTKKSIQEEYIRSCINFIAGNFSENITVHSLSSHVGLDRSYLYSLFVRYLHKSPKDYITEFRLNKASDLLHTELSIQEIARSVGYEDALLFSKSFRKHNGVSPSKYRKENYKTGGII